MRKLSWLALCGVTMFGVAVIANEKPSEAFQQAMKSNGATMQKVGKDVEAKSYDALAADAAIFKKNFSEPVGKYFTDKKNDDALTMCKAAFAAADALEKAAKAQNETAVADARKALGGTCASCHTAHREKLADGSFEIK